MFLANKIKDNPPGLSSISPNGANSFMTFIVHSGRCSESLALKILILKSSRNYSTFIWVHSSPAQAVK